jgi:hypothetical protein
MIRAAGSAGATRPPPSLTIEDDPVGLEQIRTRLDPPPIRRSTGLAGEGVQPGRSF